MVEAPNHMLRLRKAADEMRRENQNGWPLTCDAAADEIESLQRQIAELRAELSEAKAMANALNGDVTDFGQRLESAEAENARLRALPLKDEVERELADIEENLDDAVRYLVDLAGAKPSPMSPHNCRIYIDHARMGARNLAFLISRLRAGEQEGWRSIEEVPDNKLGPFLVTNNPKSLNAFNRPSHVWCVGSIHADGDGGFCAFDGYQKIHGLKLYMSVPIPASPSVSDGGNRNG